MRYPECAVCREDLKPSDEVVKGILKHDHYLLHKDCSERFYNRTGCNTFYWFDLIELMITCKKILRKAQKVKR